MNASSIGAKTQRGFTLLELIVAVSILALIAVFSWRGLDAVLHTRDSLNTAQTHVDELQRGFNRLERDALLASDARLFQGGRLRLAAANGTLVEYRLQGETLERRVLTLDENPAEQINLLNAVAALKMEIYKRNGDGSAVWIDQLNPVDPAAPGSAMSSAMGPVPAVTNSTPARFGVPDLPAPVGVSSTNPNAVPGQPGTSPTSAPVASNTDLVLTGLRVTINLKQGGVIQRLFLLGASS